MRYCLAVSCVVAAACGGAKPATTIPAPPTTQVSMEPEVLTAGTDPTKDTASVVSAKATKVRTVEGITEYKLGNGLQVLLFPDPTQSTVTVNITYLVGSRVEGYGETGMAHLLEHMMFKGSPRHRNVLKLLDERGGQANGTTWTDRTNYYETLPASQENLDWALDLEADRMINATISPDDLKTEFSVVRNEFEMGENQPLAILEERIVSTAFLWHNYGKSTIGSRADIEKVPVPALRAFYEKYYQPDNAILIVSGKFDDAAALASIEKLYGSIPKPSRVLGQSYTVEPVQDGERSVTLRRNGDINAIGVAYHTVGAASPDYPAMDCALDILDREPSGRLYKKLVEPKLAATVNANQSMFRDPYLAVVMAEVRDAKNVDKVEKTLIAEIEGLGNGKLDEKEVERWKVASLKEIELAMADSQQLAVVLSEFAALGDWRTLFLLRDRVSTVTAADVQRVARQYFKQSNRTTGRFIPTKDADRAPLTETPDITAAIKPYEGGTVKEQGEVFAATLDNIEARTSRKQLKGGIKATLLPKKTRGGKVELRLRLHWGDEKTLQGKSIAADLASSMLARGTTKKSYQELQDLENSLKSQISIMGGPAGFTLSIETFRDKLPAALDLAAEMLQSPSFPEKELEIVKQEQLAALEQQLQDPSAVAWNTLAQLVTPWPKADPRYPWSVAEQIEAVKKVKLGDIKAFYRDFAGAGHAELSVVGDFDAAAISAQTEKLFGTWISKAPYKRLDNKVFGVAGTTKSVEIKDKEMTSLSIMHDLALRDSDPDYAAWELVGQILGGDTGARIWMRLRETEGLSYGAGAWTSAGALDEAGTFGAYAIVAPQNLAKAKASMLEEINKITSGKVTDAELARAKDAWLKAQDTNLSNDTYVTNMLATHSYRGRTTQWEKDVRAKISAVTVADVERVAKKYLNPSKLVIVDAGSKPK
ncbi:MAG: insulinase family protein [Deltaproteobacteria bacterium]|nr:insulinase family protein [Deltaproteobacteria bacterium]